MNLPKKWKAVRSKTVSDAFEPAEKQVNCGTVIDAVRIAVERCYALHCKPPRELTDKQWREIYTDACGTVGSMEDIAKAWVSAYLRKQREPETVTFRAARHPTAPVSMFPITSEIEAIGYEWLEPAQTIDVVVP